MGPMRAQRLMVIVGLMLAAVPAASAQPCQPRCLDLPADTATQRAEATDTGLEQATLHWPGLAALVSTAAATLWGLAVAPGRLGRAKTR